MKAILFVLLTVAVAVCEGLISDNPDVAKIRRKRSLVCKLGLTRVMKEAVLSSLKDFRRNDPLEVGDTSDGRLQDGILRGLSTLKTLSDLKVYCDPNNILVLDSSVGLENAEIRYKWSYRFVFKFSGDVWAKVKDINVEYEIHMNSTVKYTFTVVKLKITKLEGVVVGFSGLGLMNPLVKGMMRMLYAFQEGKATETMELRIKEALEKKLNEMADSFDVFSLVSLFW